MLGQLLSNAIKYTDVGTITIAVEEGPIVHIQDTGIGIAEEDQPRIFEKGFTGYNGRADKKSTGIGLYLVKRTAELLGTPVSVVSTPGAGSTFSIDLRKKYIEVE
jgi:signal transduction histidine kinase